MMSLAEVKGEISDDGFSFLFLFILLFDLFLIVLYPSANEFDGQTLLIPL